MDERPLTMFRCKGLTKKGERCKKASVEGSDYCELHKIKARWRVWYDDPKVKWPLWITTIVAVGGIAVSVYLALSGPSKETQAKILASMERVEKRLGSDLRRRYALGYVLFTATDAEQVIPYQPRVKVRWRGTEKVLLTHEEVKVDLPDFEFLATSGLFAESGVVLPRKIGSKISIYIDHSFEMIGELIEDHGKYVHIVIGFAHSDMRIPRRTRSP